MKPRNEKLPRTRRELEAMAARYDNDDMSEVIARAEVITEPVEPMTTLTFRVPLTVVSELKKAAARDHLRYTALARKLVEEGLHSDLERRLEQLERAVYN